MRFNNKTFQKFQAASTCWLVRCSCSIEFYIHNHWRAATFFVARHSKHRDKRELKLIFDYFSIQRNQCHFDSGAQKSYGKTENLLWIGEKFKMKFKFLASNIFLLLLFRLILLGIEYRYSIEYLLIKMCWKSY